MANRYVLIVDAGTSGPRCLVFNQNADVAGACAREWRYLAEEDASPLARAFDPDVLWSTFCELITGALREAKVPPGGIAAVSVTSQRQATVFLDQAGQEIYAGPNLDLRAVFEGASIDEELGDTVYQTTGHLPSFLMAPAKLRWFQLHRPDAYGRIAFALTLADWLAWRLTGTMASEPTLAGEAGLLDIHRRDWCVGLLDQMGLSSKVIPLAGAGTMSGAVSSDAFRDTGLPAGTPVAVSGADTQCGLLGMGVSQEHQVGIVAGWSAPLQMVTLKPVLSPQRKTWAGCFLEHGKWVLESTAGDLGNAYRWLADTLYGSNEDRFQLMDQAASTTPVGSEGAVAFLAPSTMDMASPGIRTGGILFPVPLTFNELGRGHLVRASLEAMAYAIRANLRQVEDLAGVQATDITIGGGMTRTPTWVKILTDVIGREIRVSHDSSVSAPLSAPVSAIGAYLCACTALGEFPSLQEAALSVRPRLQCLKPDALASAEYQDHYERWLQVSVDLQGIDL